MGRLVKFVSGREASRLVDLGRAFVTERQRNGRVRGVALYPLAARRVGDATPPSLAMYMGQRYTRRDPQSHAMDLRPLHDDDADLFRLAVTDNLVKA